MATTAATYTNVRKEVFDADTLNKMFYDENPFLDRLEKVKRVIIGKKALVPLKTQRAGGTSVHSAAGGNLNTAGAEVVDAAAYNLAYTWFPVQIEFGALNEVTGGLTSVGEASDDMVSSAVNNIRNQITRQVLTGDGFISQCTSGGASTTVNLATSSGVSAGRVSGTDALQAGWIVPGDVVEVGTTADTDVLTTTPANVTAVTPSLTAPTITIDQSITTTSSHFVSLANARGSAGTGTLVESSGVNDIAGQTGNTVGTIAGSGSWNPAEVDSTSTLVDMDLLLRLSRRVLRATGSNYTFALTSLKQLDAIYSLLQSQVRFTGDKELGAGGSATTKWRGMEIHAFPQVPENVLYFLTLEDLEMVFGAYDKPTWASDVEGNKTGSIWAAGTTHFDDAVVYSTGMAARRRNSHASATNLNG